MILHGSEEHFRKAAPCEGFAGVARGSTGLQQARAPSSCRYGRAITLNVMPTGIAERSWLNAFQRCAVLSYQTPSALLW